MSHTIATIIASDHFGKKPALFSLLAGITGLSREAYLTNPDITLSEEQYSTLLEAYDDLTIRHKPLEYILKGAFFDKRRFVLDENVLIPRPETEYMIEAVNENGIE
jgi:release factor glutamine methyltransferase